MRLGHSAKTTTPPRQSPDHGDNRKGARQPASQLSHPGGGAHISQVLPPAPALGRRAAHAVPSMCSSARTT